MDLSQLNNKKSSYLGMGYIGSIILNYIKFLG